MNEPLQPPYSSNESNEEIARRLALLERDNDRLRRQLEGLVGPDNPCFDRTAFQKALRFYTLVLMLPLDFLFLAIVVPALVPGLLPKLPTIGSLPLLDFGGIGTSHPGIGLGIIAFGGLSVGVVAFGGCAAGLVAMGGGAIGGLALGGGAVGILAFGGGAVGYLAIGGGAVGRYALGQNAYGKAVFSMKRQDPDAVRFFVRWLPRLKAAVTTPLPVISLEQIKEPHAT